MRAGLFLDALATDHAVTLLVVPVSGPPAAAWPPFVRARTARRASVDLVGRDDPAFRSAAAGARPVAALRAYPCPALARFGTPSTVAAARQAIGGGTFDVVHILRLYLAPFLDAAAGRRLAVLDLDDDEVETRRRLAALHAARGEAASMTLEAAEGDKYRDLERAWLPRFDRVLVCGDGDRARVEARTDHPGVSTIPNAVRRQRRARAARSRRADAGPFRLLFVGTLGYAPNVDAATTLCREVLPRLRASAARAIVVDLVGARPAPAIAELARLDGVEVHADVADVAPFYGRADAVVAPLRAGGGTRIKLLEALQLGVPTVSTSAGAEGLGVTPERHFLVAEDADGLALACRRLMEEPALSRRLRAEGRRLVAARYDAGRVAQAIRKLFGAGRPGS
jgi:glycosyltransferase involved in cell wall biosynthesis